MPSDEVFKQQAEDFKSQGNAAFSKGDVVEAISLYSKGLSACERIVDWSDPTLKTLKTTLLSNRAMCYLKDLTTLSKCIDDCTSGLQLDPSDVTLRNKLLFRRAKARFLLCNLPTTSSADDSSTANTAATTTTQNQFLQDAAKDLLQVLQTDSKNKDANQLLATVRAQYKSQPKGAAATPLAKAVIALQEQHLIKDRLHNLRVILSMLDDDLKNSSMELGRLGAVSVLLDLAVHRGTEEKGEKLTLLSIQCLSQASTHPAFVREYLIKHQADFLPLVQTCPPESVVLIIAVWARIILHADRDPFDQDITGKTALDYDRILETITTALKRSTEKPEDAAAEKTKNIVVRAVMDLIGTWTAGTDRDATIRHALGGTVDPTMPVPKTQSEIHAFTPQELAAYRRREAAQKDRDGAWAFERCIHLLTKPIFETMLMATCALQDHVVRRERL